MTQTVTSNIRDGIATLTLNRPEQRNAISVEMLDSLEQELDSIESDDSVRVMILAGSGEVFCAGMDLGELIIGKEGDRQRVIHLVHRLSQAARRIYRASIPTICCVQGAAIGGGCTLMLVTDFALSHAEAKIGFAPAEMNLSPAILAPWLIRAAGPGRGKAMLLKGGTFSAGEAHRLGLLTELRARGSLQSAAVDMARELMKASHQATAALKNLVLSLDGSTDDPTLDRAADCSARIVAEADAQLRLRTRRGR